MFIFNNHGQMEGLELKNEIDSVSYAVGVNISESFEKQKLHGLSGSKIAQGIFDFKKNNDPSISLESSNILQDFMMSHKVKLKETKDFISYPKPLLDSVSYALGISVSESFIYYGINNISGKFLGQGVSDYYLDSHVITETESLALLQGFIARQEVIKDEKEKLKAKPRMDAESIFLAKNAKRRKVKTLASGLQYKVISKGKGDKPIMSSTVSTHYHGTLIDGTVFDSSIERAEPAKFGVDQVIIGWQEVLQLMPVGSKWKVFIPYDLAYGKRGTGDFIKPYSALIFEIELLEIMNE